MSEEKKIVIKQVKNSHYIEKDKKRVYLIRNGKPTVFLKKNEEYTNEIKKIDRILLIRHRNHWKTKKYL